MKRDPVPAAAKRSHAHHDLLIEVGTEELPPQTLQRLSRVLATDFTAALRQNDIQYGDIASYATPRRLAVLMHDVANHQPDGLVERRGPSLMAAFDEDGRPTPAAEGFARSCGVAVESLVELKNDKGAWLVFRKTQPGCALTKLLPELLAGVLSGLPVAKKMRWGSLQAEFVRPVHWLVVLYGDEVIDTRLYGVQSGRLTYGHRFHHPEPIQLIQPSTYAPLLESEGHVMADFGTRRQAILGLVTEAAMVTAGRAVIDDTLLDEVTGLVEWPSAVLGRFDQRFLEIPEEAVIAALRDHQKCFHIVHEDGHLLPCFIAISNIESCQPELVREGFERVIRPRLADADFFWRQDCQETLESRLERLKKVVFQQQLGSMYDKIVRIAGLAVHIAELLGCNTQFARQAALLSKCDLVTRMVGEFPELQGIMGRHYAIHEGLPKEVVDALAEQYQPRFAGDGLPPSTNGQILAMADKIDTLTAIFAIGQVPTGDRDPFALRRHALGVLRILVEKQIDLDLLDLLQKAYDPFANRFDTGIPATVFDFMVDRLKAYYAEQGIRNKVFDAVLACRPTRPYDFTRRIEAVEAFRQLPAAAALAAANKRIRNILRQADESIPPDFDLGSMTEPAERMLATMLLNMQVALKPVLQNREYKQALIQLADLRDGVDTFFDEVLVMCDDPAIRTNRLALLQRMQSLFLRIADVSRL